MSFVKQELVSMYQYIWIGRAIKPLIVSLSLRICTEMLITLYKLYRYAFEGVKPLDNSVLANNLGHFLLTSRK